MKVSIITVTFNSEKTLEDTIESLYSQSYNNIEYIIIDGKSNDRTLEIIKQYSQNFKERNIEYKWISEKDNGIYDAINKGIGMANGDIIGILNSDDYYYDSEVINDIVNSFEDNTECIYGNLKYIDCKTNKVVRLWKSKDFKKGDFEKSWTPAHPTFYCKKSVYDKYGVYRTDFKIAADVELMYRFLEKESINSKFINRYFIKMRQGGVSSRGIRSTITITKEMRKVFIENCGKFNVFKYLFYKGLKIKEFLLLKV